MESEQPRFSMMVAAVLLATSAAQASLIIYSSRAAFNAQGTIAYNSDFADFASGFTSPGDPFTRGDVTYKSGANLIIGTGTSYAPAENAIAYEYSTPLRGDIATGPNYDMFGFDLGQINDGTYTIKLFTSAAIYSYVGLTVMPISTGFDFYGFVSSPGEYFTGFEVSARRRSSCPWHDTRDSRHGRP